MDYQETVHALTKKMVDAIAASDKRIKLLKRQHERRQAEPQVTTPTTPRDQNDPIPHNLIRDDRVDDTADVAEKMEEDVVTERVEDWGGSINEEAALAQGNDVVKQIAQEVAPEQRAIMLPPQHSIKKNVKRESESNYAHPSAISRPLKKAKAHGTIQPLLINGIECAKEPWQTLDMKIQEHYHSFFGSNNEIYYQDPENPFGPIIEKNMINDIIEGSDLDKDYQERVRRDSTSHYLSVIVRHALIPRLKELSMRINIDVKQPIFREYIGYVDLARSQDDYRKIRYNNVSFSDVPISPNVEFHFILSFAIDYQNNTQPNTQPMVFTPINTRGWFTAYWDTEILTPSEVLSIKSKHPNVKVAVSIGGFTYLGGESFFLASDVDFWVTNAVRTLTDIIQKYNLDGIDIYYRNFTGVDDDIRGSPETFAVCVGRLISILKDNGVISFASIAPFDGDLSRKYYLELWRNYGQLIDYVNFQFYAYDTKWMSVDQFIDYFDAQTILYKGGNILASITSDDSGGLTAENGFFEACNTLRSSRENFMGIFVWSADISKPKGFIYENQSQALLATPQY
ncbi:hypothetical protein LguiA_021027 [Lonicera macranthoides]